MKLLLSTPDASTRRASPKVELKTKAVNAMLVGCGPHAKRVYLPALKQLKANANVHLKAVVELETQASDTRATTGQLFKSVDFVFTPPFKSAYELPAILKKKLDKLVDERNINAVIIATEPLSHMQYALWAQSRGLHILMDKPISTHKNIANSIPQAKMLARDLTLLMGNRNPRKAFIINAQRRYHPGFQYVLKKIQEVAKGYGIPITAMQSTHCDGQWRLPKEILTQEYHPYIGYGKVSHSGYHLIDVIGRFVQDSFIAAGKDFDKMGVYTSFVKATGLLSQQTREDYLRIFGEQYEAVNEFSDQQLAELYKKANEAEIDSSSLITLFNKGHATANISLNLMHNGFARRDWVLPGKDLYKGNGRVKHEYHNIEQGPFQNIQIHSYQSNDKHEVSSESDYALGGNNHFDIHVFRNSGILGGKPLEIITSKDLAAEMNHDSSKLVVEQVKHKVVKEFVEIVLGQREPTDTSSDLSSHNLSVSLMSLIYRSGIQRKEAVAHYVQ
jgi:hypothetical protein